MNRIFTPSTNPIPPDEDSLISSKLETSTPLHDSSERRSEPPEDTQDSFMQTTNALNTTYDPRNLVIMQDENSPEKVYTSLPLNLTPKETHQRAHSTPKSPASIPPRNSSLQIACEDYYTEDNAATTLHFEPDTETETSPRSAIPTDARTVDHPSRQPSHTTLSPSRSPRLNSTSPERSPKKENVVEFMATLTGDKDGVIKVADKSSKGGFGSWFSGTSAPVPLGIPVGETELSPPSSSERPASPERTNKLKKRPTMPVEVGKPVGRTQTTGLFGFFSPKTSEANRTKDIPTEIMDDPLLSLDINASLFPSGNTDPFSPSAFNNLLMNAEGLLLKLQTAYKLRTLSLHELTAEKSVMAEELDEAGTRAQMLKSQLEDMAARVLEQDLTIADLATELSREKAARALEKTAREKSIALVQANARLSQQSHSEITEEDLGIEHAISPTAGRGKWRGSTDLSTEGESDAESGGAESVFSRSRSPTFTMNSVSTRDSTPEIHQASFGRMMHNPNPPSARPKQVTSQKSTFQKIMSNMTPVVVVEPQEARRSWAGNEGVGMGEEGCGNCRGRDASVAWDTVGLLRAENQELKERVGGMEEGVDGALAVLYGYGV